MSSASHEAASWICLVINLFKLLQIPALIYYFMWRRRKDATTQDDTPAFNINQAAESMFDQYGFTQLLDECLEDPDFRLPDEERLSNQPLVTLAKE